MEVCSCPTRLSADQDFGVPAVRWDHVSRDEDGHEIIMSETPTDVESGAKRPRTPMSGWPVMSR